MSKVIKAQLYIVATLYLLVGYAGYITFSQDPKQIAGGNILDANYKKNMAISIVNFRYNALLKF